MISIDVTGGIFLDIYIMQEQGEDIHKSEIYMFPGGSGLIVAIGLAKRGYHVRLIGNVGNDFVGDYIIRILTRYGVDVDYVQRINMRTPLFVNINEKPVAIDRQLLDCDVLFPNNKSDYLFITTEISEKVINNALFHFIKRGSLILDQGQKLLLMIIKNIIMFFTLETKKNVNTFHLIVML
jgi:bifunctional ADP-heptose synthase (sugar kinase/adenylyltransferase)